jgi:small-conductance mechanosensitive channel
VKPWVSVDNFVSAGAEINQAILERFRDRQIEIPFPQREIRLLNNPSGGGNISAHGKPNRL